MKTAEVVEYNSVKGPEAEVEPVTLKDAGLLGCKEYGHIRKEDTIGEIVPRFVSVNVPGPDPADTWELRFQSTRFGSE